MSKQIMEIKDFFKKVDVYECLKQIMEIKDFFFKKVMENFVWKNIEMFLKENFVVNLDF